MKASPPPIPFDQSCLVALDFLSTLSGLDALEPLWKRLHPCHLPCRDDPFVSYGGIKSNPPTHHQHEGLALARKCRVGGGGSGGRSHVGFVTFYYNIPLPAERSCQRKPIPERGG